MGLRFDLAIHLFLLFNLSCVAHCPAESWGFHPSFLADWSRLSCRLSPCTLSHWILQLLQSDCWPLCAFSHNSPSSSDTELWGTALSRKWQYDADSISSELIQRCSLRYPSTLILIILSCSLVNVYKLTSNFFFFSDSQSDKWYLN